MDMTSLVDPQQYDWNRANPTRLSVLADEASPQRLFQFYLHLLIKTFSGFSGSKIYWRSY